MLSKKSLCLLILAIFGPLAKAISVPKAASRINEGEASPGTTLPFHVGVLVTREEVPDFQKYFCSGSLIAPDVVLTAAYCVLSDVWGSRVVAAENDLAEVSGQEQYRDVVEFVVHEDYVDDAVFVRRNDIALLKLESPFELNESVGLVELVEDDYVAEGEGFLQGWGYTDPQEETKPNVLHKATMEIYSDQGCKEWYETSARDVDVEAMLCAGGAGISACGGDTGAALTIEGKQVGVYSWTDKKFGCGVYPSVFTKVAAYKEWIDTNMAKMSKV